MKSILFFILTLLFTIGIVFPSCNVDDDIDCSCPPIDGEYFRITELSLNNYKNDGNPALVNDTVSVENYHLRIEIAPEFYSYRKCKKNWGFSLMNNALACSCIFNGISGAKERIEELTVVTKNDFSEFYMANDTVNNELEIFDHYIGENETIETFVNRNDNLLQPDGFKLFLKKSPSLNAELKLEVIIKLDNGEEFKIENEPVIIE